MFKATEMQRYVSRLLLAAVQKQYPTKQKQMNKQLFGEATDRKQLTCVLNKETGKF